MMRGFCCGLAALVTLCTASELYNEPYRPQYHFTPRQGWIGDPDGCIKYRDSYHLFWWGHATSPDLVHWSEHEWPMRGDDDSFMYFTGSVVVDTSLTTGWGTPEEPAMIAVYTAHNRKTGKQDQRLSISTEAPHRFFHYYEGSPVLDLNSRSFRDPDVFWHEETGRWVMAITLPDDRKIHFYASENLKDWTFLSEFGPVGAQDGLWEVPLLFPMPVDGDPERIKWVLVCSLGPNKGQFFVGDFDGIRFTQDVRDAAYLKSGAGIPGRELKGFEQADFWKHPQVEGVPPERPVAGYLGRGFADTGWGGNEAQLRSISEPFQVDRPCLNFLIAGGAYPGETCMNLRVDGKVVRTATGFNSRYMRWRGWDVSPWIGKEAVIELVDRRKGEWGYIAVDQVMLSDVRMDFAREHANWIDWGPDFYAVRAFRDYDGDMDSRTWMAWMGNWDYAHDTPTSWGEGMQSLPREIRLVSTSRGYEIHQAPVTALRKLRGEPREVKDLEIQGIHQIPELQPIRNEYELQCTFRLSGKQAHAGLDICVGEGRKLRIGYDQQTSMVYVDRRNAGQVEFSERFPRISRAPLFEKTDTLTFQVFVDRSSVEVFVNGGQVVFSSLLYPGPGDLGVEVFSEQEAVTLESARLWMLDSIWKDVRKAEEK